jgi:methyl-accepting chemotaxis protein
MMAILARLRIRSRLLLLLAFSVAALMVLGAFSALTIQTEASRATSFIDSEFESVRALSDVRAAVGGARRFEKDIFLTMGVDQDTERYTALWSAEVSKIEQSIARTQSLAQPAELVVLDSMLKSTHTYAAGIKDLLGKLARGELNDPWAANAAMAPLQTDIRRIDQAVEELSASLAARGSQRRTELESTAAKAPWLVVAATAISAILASLLVLAIVQSILAPIRDLQVTAHAWGQGDLSQGVDVAGQCEISDAKRDLGRMHHSLTGLVTQVHAGVEVVSNNTHEIATANNHLAQRTETAAISLQKIAASVDELTSAAQNTVNFTKQAVQSANNATQVAHRGGADVAKVVSTMHDIDRASGRIAEIIGVIDGIAFQTNILALNAAVAAARAGEQGRGFAVVATEVRSLAGRSAEAAREIKGIIAESVNTVKKGSALVENAGQTMRDIAASVLEVSTTIESIRQISNEQLEAVVHINASISGLDQATQQNAAMVEESAAGATSLAQETQNLRHAVAVFKVLHGQESVWSKRPIALVGYA